MQIDPAVEKCRNNPSGEVVPILLDISERQKRIEQILIDLGAEEVKNLPFGVTKVHIEDSKIDAICSIEPIDTIELDRPAYPLENRGSTSLTDIGR